VTANNDEPLSIIRQLELMRDLQRLANERAAAEQQLRSAQEVGLREAEERRDAARKAVEANNDAARSAAQAEFDASRQATQESYERERNAAQSEYKGLRHDVESTHAQGLQSAETEQQESSWEALTIFDAIKGRPRERMLDAARRIKSSQAELAALEADAIAILNMRRQSRVATQEFTPTPARTGRFSDQLPPTNDPTEAALAEVQQQSTLVREAVLALYQQRLPRLYEDAYVLLPPLAAWLLAIVPCGFLFGWSSWLAWLPTSFGIGLVAWGAFFWWSYPRARERSRTQFQVIQTALAQARASIQSAILAAQQRAHRETDALVSQRDEELAAVRQKLDLTREEQERRKEAEMTQAGSVFPTRLAELRHWYETETAAADRKLSETLALLADERGKKLAELSSQYEERRTALRTTHDRDWEALAERWISGYNAIRAAWANIAAQCARLFPDWNATDEQTWPRPTETPAAIAFGNVRLDLSHVKNGLPQDEQLRPAVTSAALPALMTLAEHPAMVLTVEEEGRRAATDVLQATMLRFLTAMPPGKVRFTILDPVGLGESFGSFMHLADYDELLVSSRIWTESRQIEEQLTRLTAHMETVLQKYLRNEFATIDEYNAQAGEVAEPFQVLVVANFPANFSEAAARKLMSIVTSGPRCGVYTLISVDRKLRLPTDFHVDELTSGAVHLDWQPQEKRFRWKYPAFEHLPLALDSPPAAERFNDVVRAAGAAAKSAMRVEVPFETVAPRDGNLWTGDSSEELVVPIGKAGAMRLQPVRLGRGTSQHLLVAGKTGSGKSTFLHALITNAALHYSPDQVELYLIDFKKGVEFKTYATHRLPHARVIAIESEREFGLSVLERLDGELRRRGELFRVAGVQDVAGYRALSKMDNPVRRPNENDNPIRQPGEDSRTGLSNLPEKMPRVLLVVDEFQELFVEDDKLSQDSALLLDRLVRQGRAFGIHVILGSQTLSGAYSLARSTMGQMAIRVALQCSEADAHVILSDERNMAARYLSRPGEAIYNDQNGLLAGNQPFQVVWLSEPKRVEYLRQIEDFAARQEVHTPPAIVFEGDQAADPATNDQLTAALADGAEIVPAGGAKAWLGAAVAIKEPTFVSFPRNAGSNLLVVGSEEESAFGVLANAVVALATQGSPRFCVLDGSRPDSTFAGAWQRLAATMPEAFSITSPRDVARTIAEIAAEVARREAASEEDAAPWYVVIHDAGRFRDLRRSEDDFSFSTDRDKPPKPDKQWSEILRNGPAWGVHSLVWCDSYNDVHRLVDRQTLREFELRVLFQMSATDSTNLLDTPAASRLRPHRGLFYSDDLGTQEKFRPYGPPTDEWLARVGKLLRAPSV
jgi:energy-coupling factor transporter ATP-binding protein EcfA2